MQFSNLEKDYYIVLKNIEIVNSNKNFFKRNSIIILFIHLWYS